VSATRDDLIIKAAKLLCQTGVPCAKHLAQARSIWEIFEAKRTAVDEKVPIWELVEAEHA
jgi:hypothetical protein